MQQHKRKGKSAKTERSQDKYLAEFIYSELHQSIPTIINIRKWEYLSRETLCACYHFNGPKFNLLYITCILLYPDTAAYTNKSLQRAAQRTHSIRGQESFLFISFSLPNVQLAIAGCLLFLLALSKFKFAEAIYSYFGCTTILSKLVNTKDGQASLEHVRFFILYRPTNKHREKDEQHSRYRRTYL